MRDGRRWIRTLVLAVYVLFALIPLYWMLSISLRTNEETMSMFATFPQHVTLDNYKIIFTDPSWYWGYINSIIYVLMNTVMSVLVALPAAYAFSRYRFLGDKHMFFWLLTNRMTPPAVFLLPFFQRRPDRHAHRRRARAHAVQRPARRVDSRRLHVRRAA